MTNGQRAWMISHIADGSRTLGLPVTPDAIEHDLKYTDVSLRTAGDFTPPNPYEAGLAQLRAAAAAARTQPAHLPIPPPQAERHYDANGIPDLYAAGIAKMRSAKR